MKNGQLLKEFRLKKTWTQAQLSEFIGVSLATIRNWEQERCPIHPCVVKLLNLSPVSVDNVVEES